MAKSTLRSREKTACWIARVAVAAVFVINVQCAVSFVLWPASHAAGFELSGLPGDVAVQGLGVAFLMWNATYPAVIVNPRRFLSLYVVVLVQQLIGLLGESWILLSLPVGHATLAAAIERFIVFDAVGFAIMAAAFLLLRFARSNAFSHEEGA